MTIDIGDTTNIHPRNKPKFGRRLSLVVRHLVYGEKDLVYSGPECTEMQIELPKGNIIRSYFQHVDDGLTIKPGNEKLIRFVIAGADKHFVWADVVIEGNTIVVSSPNVPAPKYVRYDWAWNPLVNYSGRHYARLLQEGCSPRGRWIAMCSELKPDCKARSL